MATYKSFTDMAEALRPELRKVGHCIKKQKKTDPALFLSLTLAIDNSAIRSRSVMLARDIGNGKFRTLRLSHQTADKYVRSATNSATFLGRNTIERAVRAYGIR